MQLTAKQEEGLKIALKRYADGEKYTCIAGYAGTGKSTLVNFIVAALGFSQDEVAYVAFTGKAADVLRRKGCKNAITAHKLLYYARRMPSGRYFFSPRPTLEQHYGVIVCDEISMLPKTMWDLLLSHKIYVLALGDPFQLPPIDKNEDNHILDYPHVFLDEIMRQAQESEIIRLSTHLREGKPASAFQCVGKEVQILPQVAAETLTAADQVICATNKQRQVLNNFMRNLHGYTGDPQPGDKIVCLHNEWNFCADDMETPLINGTIGYIDDWHKEYQIFPDRIKIPAQDYMITDFTGENGEKYFAAPIDYELLTTGKSNLTDQQIYKIYKSKIGPRPPFMFDYGYAITVWKAQGSEWDKVLVFEETYPFDRLTHQKALYTGVTRAKDKLILVSND